MVEFDETFSKRLEGKEAQIQRILYRLTPKEGYIPYFVGGRRFDSFSMVGPADLQIDARRLLSDFQTDIHISGNRIVTADVVVQLED